LHYVQLLHQTVCCCTVQENGTLNFLWGLEEINRALSVAGQKLATSESKKYRLKCREIIREAEKSLPPDEAQERENGYILKEPNLEIFWNDYKISKKIQ